MNAPSDPDNFLIPDETITIIIGNLRQTFVIGSVGDEMENQEVLNLLDNFKFKHYKLMVEIEKDMDSNDLYVFDSGKILGDTDIKSEKL